MRLKHQKLQKQANISQKFNLQNHFFTSFSAHSAIFFLFDPSNACHGNNTKSSLLYPQPSITYSKQYIQYTCLGMGTQLMGHPMSFFVDIYVPSSIKINKASMSELKKPKKRCQAFYVKLSLSTTSNVDTYYIVVLSRQHSSYCMYYTHSNIVFLEIFSQNVLLGFNHLLMQVANELHFFLLSKIELVSRQRALFY